jgi:hypothetical protein
LSVLWIGAPDCPVCHRTVSGAPGPFKSQPATLRNSTAPSAIIHWTVRCATGLSGEPASNGYLRAMVDSDSGNNAAQCAAEVRVVKSEGTGLCGVTLDCPVPQEDKAPMVDRAPNPNDWVTWWRTRQHTVPIRWRTGLSGAPIAISFPNGYGSG